MAWYEDLCALAGLGQPLSAPAAVSGGLMHRMYALDTTSGKYAVKLLNPDIMRRPDAPGNYRRAEELESLLESRGLPILPALTVNGQKMLRLGEEQYAYLFPWYGGQAVKGAAVTARHAAAIGAALAGIHGSDRRERRTVPEPLLIDWDALLPACPSLLPHRDLLVSLTDRSNEAQRRLPAVETICHNDLDTKNVLWQGGEFRIIDLETLGWSAPSAELMTTALYWSGIDERRIDPARFDAFIQAYLAAGGERPSHWLTPLDSDQSWLSWLGWVLEQGDAAQAEDTMARILCVEDFRANLKKTRYSQIHG